MEPGGNFIVRRVAKVTANGFAADEAVWMCICCAREKYLESSGNPGLEKMFEDASGMEFGEFSAVPLACAGEEFSGYEVEVGLLEKRQKAAGGGFETAELSAVALSAKKCSPFETPMAHPEEPEERARLAQALLAWQEKGKLGQIAGPVRRRHGKMPGL